MSYRKDTLHIVRTLDLEQSLDVILARDDVENPKSDPEIYLLAAQRLEVSPEECLVLEDSPAGLGARFAASANVIALATPFIAAGPHESQCWRMPGLSTALRSY